MEKQKTNTTTPINEAKIAYVLELPYDTYQKLLEYGKGNEQLMEETVRKLIEDHCK